MLTKNGTDDKKTQIQLISLDQLVPEDHLLRKIDKYIDFDFIYDLVEEKYSTQTGRPSIDPVTLIKIPIIQYMYGINSMRQTIREIEVNMAYRWFLGLDFYDKVPHFSTFGKNYKRRFEGTDLFEQIFENILLQCMKCDVIQTDTVFVDATHIKAAANRKKAKKVLVAKKSARFYDEKLKEEINADRMAHGKTHLKDQDRHDKDDDDDQTPLGACTSQTKQQKQSETDPESGWFHKGEHKEVFAYSIQTACDKNGWILDYTVHPGNEHDSKTFPELYEELKRFDIGTVVMDVIFTAIRYFSFSVAVNSLYFLTCLKSATKPFNVLLACTRPLITELSDKLRQKHPLLPTTSPYPTMRLETIRSIIPISCRRYPKSV